MGKVKIHQKNKYPSNAEIPEKATKVTVTKYLFYVTSYICAPVAPFARLKTPQKVLAFLFSATYITGGVEEFEVGI